MIIIYQKIKWEWMFIEKDLIEKIINIIIRAN